MRMRAILDWCIPVLLLVALTIPFWVTGLDIAVESRYFTPGAGWTLGGAEPWRALKHYGVIPAWIVGLSALAVFIASFWNDRVRPNRRAALFLVLALAIGPGLVVNSVFKQHWGRPRPLDVHELGGDRPYAAPWDKRPTAMGGSFASGHAAMGFFLLVPYFLLRGKRRGAAVAVFAIGILYGCLMGYARMVQGAHFPSDVLWALGFVYLTALALYYALGLSRGGEPG